MVMEEMMSEYGTLTVAHRWTYFLIIKSRDLLRPVHMNGNTIGLH